MGRALAQKLSKAGVSLVLSARGTDSLNDLAGSLPGPARVVACDVSDRASVLAAAQDVGAVDGLVFLAGVYWPQPAQEWNAEQVEAMFDVNLTGAARVLGQVVPAMVARGAGHVVITGSVSGYFRGTFGRDRLCVVTKRGEQAESIHCARSPARQIGARCAQTERVRGLHTPAADRKEHFTMPFIMEPEQAAEEMMILSALGQIPPAFPSCSPWCSGAATSCPKLAVITGSSGR